MPPLQWPAFAPPFTGQSDDLADSHIIMGTIQLRLFNFPLAISHYTKALKIYERSGDPDKVAYAQLHLAQANVIKVWDRRDTVQLAVSAMNQLMDVGHIGQKKRHLQHTARIMRWAGRKELATHYGKLADNLAHSDTYLDQIQLRHEKPDPQ